MRGAQVKGSGRAHRRRCRHTPVIGFLAVAERSERRVDALKVIEGDHAVGEQEVGVWHDLEVGPLFPAVGLQLVADISDEVAVEVRGKSSRRDPPAPQLTRRVIEDKFVNGPMPNTACATVGACLHVTPQATTEADRLPVISAVEPQNRVMIAVHAQGHRLRMELQAHSDSPRFATPITRSSVGPRGHLHSPSGSCSTQGDWCHGHTPRGGTSDSTDGVGAYAEVTRLLEAGAVGESRHDRPRPRATRQRRPSPR